MSSSRIPAFSLALVLGALLAGGNVFFAQRFVLELLEFSPITVAGFAAGLVRLLSFH